MAWCDEVWHGAVWLVCAHVCECLHALGESGVFQDFLADSFKTDLLAGTLSLPNFKVDVAEDQGPTEDEIPLPSLTRLQWDKETLTCPPAIHNRWSEHEKFESQFKEVVAHINNISTAPTITTSSDGIGSSPQPKGVKQEQPDGTPPAKRAKTEPPETFVGNRSCNDLPEAVLASISLTQHCTMQISPGPKVFIVNSGKGSVLLPAGKELVGFFGAGTWWQKAGSKKDVEATDKDIQFALTDANDTVLLQGVCRSLFDCVNEQREKDLSKSGVQYHELHNDPKEGNPGFFTLAAKYHMYWKMMDYKAEKSGAESRVKKEHGASALPFKFWSEQVSCAMCTWHVRWGRHGLQPLRPTVCLTAPVRIDANCMLEISDTVRME